MSHDQIPGFSSFLPLYDLALDEARPGAVFVEVGVALGHSIAYLAERAIALGKDAQIFAVDPWAGNGRNGEQQELADRIGGDFTLFVDMMRRHAPAALERVRVLRLPSVQAARLFDKKAVDFVLIDGPHDFDSVQKDIVAWAPKVRRGGILAGDDHREAFPGVEQACRAAFGSDYVIEPAQDGNGYWWRRMP